MKILLFLFFVFQLFYKDSSCVLFDTRKRLKSEAVDAVLGATFNEFIPVYKMIDTTLMVGFIETKSRIDEEIEWRTESYVLENVSLEKLFSIGNYATNDSLSYQYGLALNDEHKNAFIKLNNRFLLKHWTWNISSFSQAYQECFELKYLFSLDDDMGEAYEYLRKRKNAYYCSTDRNPLFRRVGEYVRTQVEYNSNWFHSRYIYPNTSYNSGSSYQYETYLVDNPEEKISFYSLFKKQEKIYAYLENYLIKYLDESQPYKDACPDVSVLLEMMMSNFCLTEVGLKMMCVNRSPIVIPYADLSAYFTNAIKKKVKGMNTLSSKSN